VINVSWKDAEVYADWQSRKTGQRYRLLSEAEYEYAARAGTDTLFWWGDSISTAQANYHGEFTYAGGPKGIYRHKTLPVRSFEPNPWGLYQVHGNVATWTTDLLGGQLQRCSCRWLGMDDGKLQVSGSSWRFLVRLSPESPRCCPPHHGAKASEKLCRVSSCEGALFRRLSSTKCVHQANSAGNKPLLTDTHAAVPKNLRKRRLTTKLCRATTKRVICATVCD